jgi:hypothetical protein
LLDGEAEALTRKAVELAKMGNPVALRLCLERILPPARERVGQFEMPELIELDDAPRAIAAIVKAVAQGELTAADATALGRLVELFLSALDSRDGGIPQHAVFYMDVDRASSPPESLRRRGEFNGGVTVATSASDNPPNTSGL